MIFLLGDIKTRTARRAQILPRYFVHSHDSKSTHTALHASGLGLVVEGVAMPSLLLGLLFCSYITAGIVYVCIYDEYNARVFETRRGKVQCLGCGQHYRAGSRMLYYCEAGHQAGRKLRWYFKVTSSIFLRQSARRA